MACFLKEYCQDKYYVISLTTYQSTKGKVKSAWFYGFESSHENLNSYEFFKLLLASNILSLAFYLLLYFLTRIAIISSTQKYTINILGV